MNSNRLILAVAALSMAKVSVADETGPRVKSNGVLEFKVELRLPSARGHYQPRYYFKDGEFLEPARLTMVPGEALSYRDQAGQASRLRPVSRDGNGHFALENEESYLAFRMETDAAGSVTGWSAWDAKGTHYSFVDLEGFREIFFLRRVTDANGNRAEYRYAGTRLTGIEYNFYDPSNPDSTAAVPASATTFASSVEFDYDAVGRLHRVRALNRSASGMSLVRAYEHTWYGSTRTGVFTEITQGGARRLDTTLEHDASVRLVKVTTPRGARYEVTRNSGSGISSLTLSGPGLQPVTTNYWYETNRRTASQDSVTRIVKYIWWEPRMGETPARIDWGLETAPGTATAPPQYAVFRQRIIEHTWRGISTGTCVAPAASPEGVMLAATPPDEAVLSFASRDRETVWVDGNAMSRERTISCGNVDAYGNVWDVSVDADLARSGDEYIEAYTFAAPTATHSCSDCLLTSRVMVPPYEQTLSYERYVYDPFAHVKELWRKDQNASPEQLVRAWDYSGNGNLRAVNAGATTTMVSYEPPYQLRVARESVTGTAPAKTLVTDFRYDAFGNQDLVTGPYVAGSAPARQRGFKYDDLGRVIAVARGPISGPLVTDGIGAFEYGDGATAPSRVTAYSFAVPKTFSLDAIPQTSDVVQSSSFFDALGREIQRRERLGGTGSGAAEAHVVDDLGASLFRVSRVAIYDGSRLTAALEPFYSANAGFVDYRSSPVDNASSTPAHALLRSFDARGRITCEAFRPVSPGAAIPAAEACTSDFTEGPSYTRATATLYRWYGGYLAVKIIPPENNLATTPEGRARTGPESIFDASGRLGATYDVDLNATVYAYDPMGRLIRIERHPSRSVAGRPSVVTSSLSYDLMDRVFERTDPNAGTRTFWYDAQGNVVRVQLPPRPLGSGVTGRDEVWIDYDMGRPSATQTCVATSATAVSCTADWTLHYDQPPDPSFGNVAGRLAYAQKAGVATIQFGYSPEGAVTRRAYALAGVPGTFELADTVLLDGRVSASTLTSPSGSFSFDNAFDSFGRLTRIASSVGGGTTYWRARATGATAHDALGRLGLVDLDQTGSGPSLVHASWQYRPYSGLEEAARVSLGLTDLHWVTGMTYRGRKLIGYRDEVGKTAYSYWYNDAGQLRGSNAAPFDASPLSQSSSMCSSYTLTKSYGAGPSFGNLERVREVMSTSVTDTYDYAGLGLQSMPPGPDAPTTVVTNSAAKPFIYDHGGRVTSKSLGAESFEYDVLGQLVRVLRGGVQAEALAHDPFGLLLGRFSGNEVTYYLGERATVTATALAGCTAPACSVDAASVRVDVHLRAAGMRVASVRVQGGATGRVLYYHRDRLASVVATSLGGGVAGASYRYGPWGDLRIAQADAGDAVSERGFADAIRLSGSLLVMGVRVYDAQARQFLQPDPFDPMTYTYVGGDPVNFVDPSGMGADDPPIICEGDCYGEVTEEIVVFADRVRLERMRAERLLNDFLAGAAIDALIRGRGGPGGFWRDVVEKTRDSLLNDPAYRDLNFSYGIHGVGITVGLITVPDTGMRHLEFGFGLMTSGPSLTHTVSARNVTPGWNVAAQANFGPAALQIGIDPHGYMYSEIGANYTWYPGASFTAYWVTEGGW